jgi:septal ring factor EnvC (AmiA/AmiB activator)
MIYRRRKKYHSPVTVSKKILLLLVSIITIGGLTLVPASSAYSASVTDLQKQKQALQDQIARNKQLADQKQKEADELAKKVGALQGDIAATEQQISRTNGEISQVNQEISRTEGDITSKETELDKQNRNMNMALIEIYRATNKSTLELLLGSSDFAEAMSGGTQLMALQQQLDTTIKTLQTIKAELERQKAVLNGKQQSLSSLRDQQKSQERAVVAQKNYTASLQQGAEQAASEAIAATKKAEQQIGSVDDAIRRALAASGNKSVGYLTGKSVGTGTVIGYMGSTGNSTGPHLHLEVRQQGGYGGDGNINDFLNIGYYNTSNPASNCSIGMNGNSLNLNFGLAKPMNNPRYVTACWGYGGYGDSGYHGGVDMVEYNGAPIMAAKSGTVIFHGGLGGWGNAVVIYHGGGFWTLYGHMI